MKTFEAKEIEVRECISDEIECNKIDGKKWKQWNEMWKLLFAT